MGVGGGRIPTMTKNYFDYGRNICAKARLIYKFESFKPVGRGGGYGTPRIYLKKFKIEKTAMF